MKEEGEKIFLGQPWKIFAFEAFLFSLTLGLGVATTFRISEIFEIQEIEMPQISFSKFIFNFLLATLFILFIVRFIKFKIGKKIIFKTLFILATFFGGLLLIEAWLPEPLPLIFTLSLIFWWWEKPSILNQDILIILGIAGMGSILGLSLKPEIVIILLIIFSIYDFIAVYKTKHMIKMAKEMIESRAILALVIPPNIFGFRESLEKIQPGGNFLILGGGDITFPLLLCSSLVSKGILNSLVVAIFSLFGLFAGFYFFISQPPTSPGGGRQPIPALPPIALFSIIGYLITRLI
jgi:presenilin-like A22 family membrane protease